MVIPTGKALDHSRLKKSGNDTTPVEHDYATGRSRERDLAQDARRFSALLRPSADTARSQEPALHLTSYTEKQISKKEPERKPEETFAMPSAGDRVLQGLQGTLTQPALSPAAPAVVPATTTTETHLDRIAEQLAQRVLVSERSTSGASEVRIQLRESVLQGTEIRLTRQQGELKIQFHVPNADLARQLGGQTDGIQQMLSARLNEPVRIDIAIASPSSRADTGQPGDGHSRNRQDPYEAWHAMAKTNR